jgi:hypothetical protein
MLLRRIRGLVVTGVIWGVVTSLVVVGFTALMFFLRGEPGSGREIADAMVSLLGMAFGLGAVGGVLFAALVMAGARRHRLETVPDASVRLWGAIAGGAPLALAELLTNPVFPGSIGLTSIAVGAGAAAGAALAPALLRLARRAGAGSVSEEGRRAPTA